MIRVDRVNGVDPETARRRPKFEDLTPVHPDVLINLETDPKNLTQRLINLVNPIGKGQRALIVSPPKAGKTMLLKHIANGISTNYPEIHLMVALIGERPEEVTDMRRSVKGEVISSTFDEPTENHTHVAEMALEIAKRLVETGRDVVILLDRSRDWRAPITWRCRRAGEPSPAASTRSPCIRPSDSSAPRETSKKAAR